MKLANYYGDLMKALRISSLLFISIFFTIAIAHGGENSSAQLERVGGNYAVHSIEKLNDRSFRIEFRHQEADEGPYRSLFLISDHVHLGLEEGMVLRLSGEVKGRSGGEVELTQVLLFLPTDYGKTPVWMLSKKSVSKSLKGARFLEMHAPGADFYLF